MLKKSITYTDFNGGQQTEDFYFHMSKAELIELEMSHKGGMSTFLQNIASSNDSKAIISEFKELILGAYGVRSDDGRRFIKNAQLREDFQSSEAYSALFFELCTNADAAAAFVNGIVPAGLDKEMARVSAAEEGVARAHPSDTAAKTAEPLHNESMAERASYDNHTPEEHQPQVGRNVFEQEQQDVRTLTRTELLEMEDHDLREGLASGRYRIA